MGSHVYFVEQRQPARTVQGHLREGGSGVVLPRTELPQDKDARPARPFTVHHGKRGASGLSEHGDHTTHHFGELGHHDRIGGGPGQRRAGERRVSVNPGVEEVSEPAHGGLLGRPRC
ncbi:hypothetical protein [Paenarthrobacter sp. NPDC058040]|uniref:hypothetical protein n=1 Tax=unclassified Paenarthrobacter TaxID=2634190 RepID=UPI0036DDEE2A